MAAAGQKNGNEILSRRAFVKSRNRKLMQSDVPSNMTQNFVTSAFSVISAQAEIQKILIRRVFISWAPACAGVTILFASSC